MLQSSNDPNEAIGKSAVSGPGWRKPGRFWLVELGRLIRFGITGVVATFVYAAVTLALAEGSRTNAVTASIIGYFVSAGVSYYGHMRFSFGVGPDHKAYLWRFLAISALSLALNILVTWATTHLFGYSARVSVVLVSILVPATNYVCNRFWVFRSGLKLAGTDALFVAEPVSSPSTPAGSSSPID